MDPPPGGDGCATEAVRLESTRSLRLEIQGRLDDLDELAQITFQRIVEIRTQLLDEEPPDPRALIYLARLERAEELILGPRPADDYVDHHLGKVEASALWTELAEGFAEQDIVNGDCEAAADVLQAGEEALCGDDLSLAAAERRLRDAQAWLALVMLEWREDEAWSVAAWPWLLEDLFDNGEEGDAGPNGNSQTCEEGEQTLQELSELITEREEAFHDLWDRGNDTLDALFEAHGQIQLALPANLDTLLFYLDKAERLIWGHRAEGEFFDAYMEEAYFWLELAYDSEAAAAASFVNGDCPGMITDATAGLGILEFPFSDELDGAEARLRDAQEWLVVALTSFHGATYQGGEPWRLDGLFQDDTPDGVNP